MNVSSIGSSSWSVDQSSSSFKSRMEEGRKQWDALQEALESGDLEAAKSAFETLEANRPEPPPGGMPGKAGSGSQDEGPEKDFEALRKALESGDVEAAQEAFATIQSHRPPDRNASAAVDPSFNNDTSGMVGTLLNLVA